MSFLEAGLWKRKKKQDSTKAHREAGAMTTLGSSKVEQMLHRDQWSIGREHHSVDLLEWPVPL